MKTFDPIAKITAIKPGFRILRQGRQPSKLPLPENLRRKKEIENWRSAIWVCKHIWFSSLDPQVRELARKSMYRMQKFHHPEMIDIFMFSMAQIYLFTGSVKKLESYILAVFNGATFLIDTCGSTIIKPVPLNNIDLESLKPLLIYDLTDERLVVDENLICRAKRLSEFIGPMPTERPWNDVWIAELDDLRDRTIAKFGIAEADSLWGKSTSPTPVVPPLAR